MCAFDKLEFKAWKEWKEKSVRNTPLSLVRAAVIASNPHNTQPWKYRILESQSGTITLNDTTSNCASFSAPCGSDFEYQHVIEVHVDRNQFIEGIDPLYREMYIGIGCAIENALLAAPFNGYETVLEYVNDDGFVEGDRYHHRANIYLKETASTDTDNDVTS